VATALLLAYQPVEKKPLRNTGYSPNFRYGTIVFDDKLGLVAGARSLVSLKFELGCEGERPELVAIAACQSSEKSAVRVTASGKS